MSYVWFIIGLVITILLLWLTLFLASRWVVSEDFAEEKKQALLLASVLIVIILPLIADGVGAILNMIGNGIVAGRNLITPSGKNYLIQLVPIISFLVFFGILKFVTDMEWRNAVWVSLCGIFLLYCLYSFFPELDLLQVSYT